MVVLVCLVPLGYVVKLQLDHWSQEMWQSKLVRTSPATVVRKVDGTIYYLIDNFDSVPPDRRSQAVEAEDKRFRESGPRTYDSFDWYDRVEVGSKVYVRYQCFSNGELLLVSVGTTPY